jgi:hypothetical protein
MPVSKHAAAHDVKMDRMDGKTCAAHLVSEVWLGKDDARNHLQGAPDVHLAQHIVGLPELWEGQIRQDCQHGKQHLISEGKESEQGERQWTWGEEGARSASRAAYLSIHCIAQRLADCSSSGGAEAVAAEKDAAAPIGRKSAAALLDDCPAICNCGALNAR